MDIFVYTLHITCPEFPISAIHILFFLFDLWTLESICSPFSYLVLVTWDMWPFSYSHLDSLRFVLFFSCRTNSNNSKILFELHTSLFLPISSCSIFSTLSISLADWINDQDVINPVPSAWLYLTENQSQKKSDFSLNFSIVITSCSWNGFFNFDVPDIEIWWSGKSKYQFFFSCFILIP